MKRQIHKRETENEKLTKNLFSRSNEWQARGGTVNIRRNLKWKATK